MQRIQETKTIIKAEDGKVLRKKSDGRIVGDTVHLGYDYYDAGILLKEPHLAKPDDYEEVDMVVELDEEGNEIKVTPPDNTYKRLKRISEILTEEKKEINNYELSTSEMLDVKNLYPRWGEDIKEGDYITQGTKFQYNEELWETTQDITLLPFYEPSENTKHIYKKIEDENN